jgi:adenylate kinase family enzyme
VAVVGNTGSGKTTLARELAMALDVPHIELDALFWRPDWETAPTEEFQAAVDNLIADNGWVVDGNYFGRLGERVLARAELVVWMDPPLRTIMIRLLRRTIARIRSREEMWGTNRETVRDAFFNRNSLLLYALKMHRKRGERADVISRYPHVRLRSASETAAWLKSYLAGDRGRTA